MRFAAAEADIIGVNPSTAAGRNSEGTARDALPGSIDAKFALIREAAGERFDSLEFNAWLSLAMVTDDARTSALYRSTKEIPLRAANSDTAVSTSRYAL